MDGWADLPQRARRVATREGLIVARSAVHAVGSVTSGARVLPDFLVIGTMRGGTTSLYQSLVRHPRVAGAVLDKEVHYFDLNATRDERWYRARFPTRAWLDRRARAAGGPVLVGESTPYYLFHPAVAERVAHRLPQVRAVVLLRDPVERAWSHYRHEVDIGCETLPFDAALDAEPRRLDGEEERLLRDPAATSFAHQHHAYVSRGRYARQLRRWFDALGRDRVLVLRSEDLYADPAATFARVLAFLDLPAADVEAWRVRNAATPHPLDDATRQRLRTALRDDREDLVRLLGSDPGWPA